MRTLLDSVILIDFLNGLDESHRYLFSVWGDACVSVVTRAEVLSGYDAGARRDQVVDFLSDFDCLVIDAEVSDMAGLLRRTERWKLPDAFQAALAQVHGLRLATRNTRDFPPDRYPFVEVPYRLGAG